MGYKSPKTLRFHLLKIAFQDLPGLRFVPVKLAIFRDFYSENLN